MDDPLLRELITPARTKIAMILLDGLGGLPRQPGGLTELESARTPHLDTLAERSDLGLTVPVAPGITSGSGPGHLAIFGYDPFRYPIGRGALEALGVDFELGPNDLAARGNFCSVDAAGLLTDRRAGRIPTDLNRELCRLLRTIRVEGAEFFLETVKEHRFAFVARGPGLEDALTETDPQRTGVPVLPVRALRPGSDKAADLTNQFLDEARRRLAGRSPANMVLLRGFAASPVLPTFQERYALRAAAIAVQGMYRGVARLAGMQVLPLEGDTLAMEFAALERHWGEFDFFYLHVKPTDTAGERGDFDGKVRVIEDVDAQLPRLLALSPDVVIIGGDHSSPAVLQSHSWHPVPLLLYSKYARPAGQAKFGESACAQGSLGMLRATDVMPLALAHAGRLAKYGA
jgi:2,3-bisphosphoglycerate-independent phosphoglycerate mutase